MSIPSMTNLQLQAYQNGYDWSKPTTAPTWNNWTDNAKNAYEYDPGTYQSAPAYSWASWTNGPTRSAYSGANPTFQRLSTGDYKDFETALRTPGEISARNALKTGQIGLNDTMTANGMYGSSLAAKQANENLYGKYLDTMANNSSNATAQRYNMEQKDNQFANQNDLSVFNTRVGENTSLNQMGLQENLAKNNALFGQNQNYNNYNLSKSNNENNYNLGRANWGLNAANQYNTLLATPYEDQWRRANFDSNQNNQTFNRMYQFWNNADPLKDEYQMNQTASLAKSRDGGGSSALGALGSIGGSVLGSAMGGATGGAGGMFSSLLGKAGSMFSSSGTPNGSSGFWDAPWTSGDYAELAGAGY